MVQSSCESLFQFADCPLLIISSHSGKTVRELTGVFFFSLFWGRVLQWIFLIACGLSLIDFPGGSDGKASVYNAGDPGSIPGLGRSPEEENGYPLQYSGLENSWGHKESDMTEHPSLSLLCT